MSRPHSQNSIYGSLVPDWESDDVPQVPQLAYQPPTTRSSVPPTLPTSYYQTGAFATSVNPYEERLGADDKRYEAGDRRFDAGDEKFNAGDRGFDAADEGYDAEDRRFDAEDKMDADEKTEVPSDASQNNEAHSPPDRSAEFDEKDRSQQAPANGGAAAPDAAAADQPPATGGKDGGGKIERSRKKVAVIMFALGMAVFLAALDVTIVTTALPTIAGHFHSSAGYTWVGSAYLLGTAAASPIWGKLSDIYGRKPTLLIANAGFFVGSLLAGLSVNIGMLIVARAVQGISGGGLVVLVNIVIGDLFSPRRRGAYYGVIGGVWAIASSLGPIVGGSFTEKVSWRWCFYINLPLDGLAFVIILFFLDIKTPTTPFWAGVKSIDFLGALLIIGGTLMFLFGLEYGGSAHPWDSAIVLCLLIFGVVCIVLFGLVEWKVAKYPIIPLRIFRYRSNIAALGVCFCHGFVFIGGSYYLPLYFQAVLGASPILSGVYVLLTTVALSIGSIATGIFIRVTGKYMPPIIFGLSFMTLGYGLFILFGPTANWPMLVCFQLISGLGTGPNFQAPLIALQSLIKPRDIATATATFGFTRTLASAISIVVGQVVFQNEMKKRAGVLTASLGPKLAAQLGGGNAGANTQLIDSLPAAQRAVARTAYAQSLSKMWILYTVFAGVGLAIAFLITKQGLKREHEETATGLEAQEANRLEVKKEEDERRAAKAEIKAGRKSKEMV